MIRPGLEELLGEKGAQTFLKDCWPGDFFQAEGADKRLNVLTNYQFDDLLKIECDQLMVYRLINGQMARMRIQKGQEKLLYDTGYTIHFFNLKLPALDTWLQALEADLGLVPGTTRVSAYASQKGEGLETHFDGIDNFVVQAQGSKRWQIAENMHVRWPTFGHVVGDKVRPENHAQAPGGFPDDMPADHRVIDLHQGSVMFLPRGTWHATETVETSSLHFNIRVGLGQVFWRDLIELVLRTTPGAAFDDLRAPITPLFQGNELAVGVQDDLRRKMQAVAKAVNSGGLPLQKEAILDYIKRARR